MRNWLLKVFIVESTLGVFGFNEKNKMVGYVLFPNDVNETANKIMNIRDGRIIEELLKLVEKLKEKGYEKFIFESGILAKKISEELKFETEVEKPNRAAKNFRKNLGKIAVKIGRLKKPDDITSLLHQVSMVLAKEDVKKAGGKKDLLVAQAVLALGDLDKTLNLFSNRLREWYGLHFPELGNYVEDHEAYLRLTTMLGDRNNFEERKIEQLGLSKEEAKKITRLARSSMGAQIAEKDLDSIKLISQKCLELYETRKNIENYIDKLVSVVAPNIQALVSSTLGARLIAAVGSLKNLAAKPSSTIQVLGAEKALFRSLQTKSKPPKHGFIFQHPQIRNSPRWQRGKISRALAGKLAIAARVDAYSGEYVGDKLKAEFEQRVKEIKEKYSKPNIRR